MKDKVWLEGYDSFDPNKSVYEVNPYKTLVEIGPQLMAFQIEATEFFNGWETARYVPEVARYSIFLDDFRFPNWVGWVPLPPAHSWYVARHYYDFIGIIKSRGLPEFISWDFDLDRHQLDLGDLPYKDGLDCAKWLEEYCQKNNQKFPKGVVHSTNPEHGPKIRALISKYE